MGVLAVWWEESRELKILEGNILTGQEVKQLGATA